jgi:hypothetical protein
MASEPITYIRIEQFGAPTRFDRVTGSEFPCGENQLGLLTFHGCKRIFFRVRIEAGTIRLITLEAPLQIGDAKIQSQQSVTLAEGASVACQDYRLTMVPLCNSQAFMTTAALPEGGEILSF